MSVVSRVAAELAQSNPDTLARVLAHRREGQNAVSQWFEGGAVYRNRETGKVYKPHHADETTFVTSDGPRYFLCKGAEGSGKSVAGVIKDLEKLRRGMSGIFGSPDFEHFKKSAWPEFQRWCPPNALIPRHRPRLAPEWTPRGPFTLVFKSPEGLTSRLMCGGFEDPGGWEGPNVNFAHWDEARRNKTAAMLKVLDGRCRIAGPKGEPPQIYLTTTPRKHWLYEYFVGPLDPAEPDLFEDFREDSRVITLRLDDNAANLAEGYVQQRRSTLLESEIRVLVEAEWEDEDDTQRFLPQMIWWDTLREDLPPLGRREPVVLAVDAATGRVNTKSDCFAVVAVTRHPDKARRKTDVAVRFVELWQAKAGEQIDFRGSAFKPGPESVIRKFCKEHRVLQLVYDPTQLVDLTQRLTQDGVVWCEPFQQGADRNSCDRRLLELMIHGQLAHTGDHRLRSHIDNADRKVDITESKLRIVKGRGRVDLAVALAMGSHAILELNL